MQCQNCKQHIATIHLTEITNGQREETHLCQMCAQEQGLTVKSQIPLNELLSTLLAAQSETEDDVQVTSETPDDSVVCPACGMSMSRFRKESLLGCSYDYDLFDDQLKNVIQRSQNGSLEHCGKVPSRSPAEGKKQVEMINLRKQLEDAVKYEDYEKAAMLRDQIGRL